MAILSTIKKVLPYIKTATGYVLCRLSSQAVEMDDGTTLQESYDSLNSKSIKHETVTTYISLPTGRSYFDMGPITIPQGYTCIGLSVTHVTADWIQCSASIKDSGMINAVAYNYFSETISGNIDVSAVYTKT